MNKKRNTNLPSERKQLTELFSNKQVHICLYEIDRRLKQYCLQYFSKAAISSVSPPMKSLRLKCHLIQINGDKFTFINLTLLISSRNVLLYNFGGPGNFALLLLEHMCLAQNQTSRRILNRGNIDSYSINFEEL